MGLRVRLELGYWVRLRVRVRRVSVCTIYR